MLLLKRHITCSEAKKLVGFLVEYASDQKFTGTFDIKMEPSWTSLFNNSKEVNLTIRAEGVQDSLPKDLLRGLGL